MRKEKKSDKFEKMSGNNLTWCRIMSTLWYLWYLCGDGAGDVRYNADAMSMSQQPFKCNLNNRLKTDTQSKWTKKQMYKRQFGLNAARTDQSGRPCPVHGIQSPIFSALLTEDPTNMCATHPEEVCFVRKPSFRPAKLRGACMCGWGEGGEQINGNNVKDNGMGRDRTENQN